MGDFLDSYFRTGLQTSGSGTTAPSGSSINSANAQILKKSSAYWVATTHVQYNLDMADINIAANRTADAKANMDSAAAAYFGCGDTNPVPLPKYKGTQIAYPTAIDGTDIGSNPQPLLQLPCRLSGTPPTPSSLRPRSGTLPRLPWQLICPATAWAVPQGLLRLSRRPRRTPRKATGNPDHGGSGLPLTKPRPLLVVVLARRCPRPRMNPLVLLLIPTPGSTSFLWR